ncbi:GNAT family N-acetyltransferase [Actinomadura craniellae]|uniref:GNAT family N-acetyltransferase n=1 Tax=Actinomadura craniellae TaxID=2231787 RepID=A0A365HBI3_9ACTN|nr:GNAT family N-acetyltransferase [Actinomadura craniellae]RAY16445.1 GNAT family N-acetyltransferase [Actinomadura craniellae]
MSIAVRAAEERDLPLLPGIERSADGMFGSVGIVFPPGPTVVEELIGGAAEIFVVGDPPVGFAAVSELDGGAYLEQIALRAGHTGRGLGGVLLGRVLDVAAGPVTLLTFRDVRWNGPWYARHGFAGFPAVEWGPGLRAHWQAEIDAGLHALGPRLAMRHPGR